MSGSHCNSVESRSHQPLMFCLFGCRIIADSGEDDEDEDVIIERRRKEREALLQVSHPLLSFIY